jgi:hypothetical protein
MEEIRPIEEIIDDVATTLSSKTLSTADKWGDLATEIRVFIYRKTSIVLPLEIAASKIKMDLRPKHKSSIDAENEWKTTKEYEAWQAAVRGLEEADKVERSCRNQGGLRKN